MTEIEKVHFTSEDDEKVGIIWYYETKGGRKLFGHNGGDPGAQCEMFMSLTEKIGVAVIANTDDDNLEYLVEIENEIFTFAGSVKTESEASFMTKSSSFIVWFALALLMLIK